MTKPKKKIEIKINFEKIKNKLKFNFFFSHLIQRPGFVLEERTKDNLPKELPANTQGTCHFLNNYHHPDVDESEPLDVHIQAAVTELEITGSL